MNVVTGQQVKIAFPARPNDARKSEFGHVLVIAGSLGNAGAACLAALAAVSAGAGQVTVACPKSIEPIVAGFSPVLMTVGLSETHEGTVSMAARERLNALLAEKDVVVLGPGLSRNRNTARVSPLAAKAFAAAAGSGY